MDFFAAKLLTNYFFGGLILANDCDEDDREYFRSQRVRVLLRADDESSQVSITSESGVRAAMSRVRFHVKAA